MFHFSISRTVPFLALVTSLIIVAVLTKEVHGQDALPTDTSLPQQEVLLEETPSQVANRVVRLPMINLLPSQTDFVTVRGQLLVAGRPLPYVPFVIDGCEDSTHATRGITDANGYYALNVPSAPNAANTEVSLTYPATRTVPYTGTIGMFRSICMMSTDGRAALPTIELGSVEFETPDKGEDVEMPILFGWQSRSNPAPDEMYQVVGTVQYACQSCAPVEVPAAAAAPPSSRNSFELGCVNAGEAMGDIRTGEFQIVVSNETGVGSSEPRYITVSKTVRCTD